MKYGLPYKGSKSKIADWLIDNLPENDTFVDVFFGGGAVTHCALLKNKYKHFIINDLRSTTQLFIDCIHGKYHDEKRWISREDFFKSKDVDPYVACCWSFGNDYKSYLYGKDIEPYKKAIHYAIIYDDWSLFKSLMPELIAVAKPLITSTKDINERRLRLHRLSSSLLQVQHLINLKRLERIQQLEILENVYTDNITSYNKDYKDLEIPQGALVYCDPPYNKSAENYGGFNTEEFLAWCVEKSKTNHIYISEYNINDSRFKCIAETKRLVTASAKTSVNKIEKLYTVI